MDAPGEVQSLLLKSAPDAGGRDWKLSEIESRWYCREGVWTRIILVPPDHAAPYAGSQVFFPGGLTQNILHIFRKIIFLTKVGTSQMVCPQPLTN